jgi:hypothetical protein
MDLTCGAHMSGSLIFFYLRLSHRHPYLAGSHPRHLDRHPCLTLDPATAVAGVGWHGHLLAMASWWCSSLLPTSMWWSGLRSSMRLR